MDHREDRALPGYIKDSRERTSLADFPNALSLLSRHGDEFHASGDTWSLPFVAAEMTRVHILNENYQAAKNVLEKWNIHSSGHPLENVLRVQKAYIEILTDCNLEEAATVGGVMWETMELSVQESELSPIGAWIVYYCFEIFHFVATYGNRKQRKRLNITEKQQKFLAVFVFYILALGEFQLEALALLEHMVRPEQVVEILSGLVGEDHKWGPAKVDALITLLRFSDKVGGLDEAASNAIVREVESVARSCGHKTSVTDLNAARAIIDSDNPRLAARVESLISISEGFLRQGYFGKSGDATRAAQDMLGKFTAPQPKWVVDSKQRLLNLLRDNYTRCGDMFGQFEASFAQCDELQASTDKLSLALRERKKLLNSPQCFKIPLFGDFHHMQAQGYIRLHQVQDALFHARRYFKYCKRCRRRSEQALARNVILRCISHPQRASFPTRISRLESIMGYIEHALAADGANLNRVSCSLSRVQSALDNSAGELAEQASLKFDAVLLKSEIDGFSTSMAQTHLLKLEVDEEQNRLEQADNSEAVERYIDILKSAEESWSHITTENYRPTAAILATQIRSFQSLLTWNGEDAPAHQAIKQFRLGISLGEIYFWLIRARTLESDIIFEHCLDALHERQRKVEENGNTLGMIAVYECYAVMALLLVQLCDNEQMMRVRAKMHFKSDIEGLLLMIKHIKKCFELRDLVAKECAQSSRWHSLKKKQAFMAGFETLSELLQEALRLCVYIRDPEVIWNLAQLAKARAVSSEQLFNDPTGHHLSSVTVDEMRWASTASTRKIVFVDWVSTGTDESPLLVVTIEFVQVEGFPVAEYGQMEIDFPYPKLIQYTEGYRQKLHQPGLQDYLDHLQPVIAPLEKLTQDDDLLVLSPTSHLHNIPLHALKLGEKALIERNPIVYTPSLAVLTQCLHRLEAPSEGVTPGPWKAAIMAAYDDMSNDPVTAAERARVYDSVHTLCKDFAFGGPPVTGNSVSTSNFLTLASDVNLIHFHGHSSYDPDDIESQALILGKDESLSLSKLFEELELKNAPHATIIACDSGVQDFSLGLDEPLGILTAFIVTGAASAIAPLWPIKSEDGRAFSEELYKQIFADDSIAREEPNPVVNLAVALREAALRIRKEKLSPYHWAGYILYGSWFCRRKPRS